MSNLDYVVTTKSAEVVDSFTAPDGTLYEAVASGSGTGIIKTVTNEDGTTTSTVLNAAKGKRKTGRYEKSSKRKSYNSNKLKSEFANFKAAAEAAAASTEAISYTDADVTTGGSGFLKKDKQSTKIIPRYASLTLTAAVCP